MWLAGSLLDLVDRTLPVCLFFPAPLDSDSDKESHRGTSGRGGQYNQGGHLHVE